MANLMAGMAKRISKLGRNFAGVRKHAPGSRSMPPAVGHLFDHGQVDEGRDTGSPSSSGSAASLDKIVSSLTSGTLYTWRLKTISTNALFPRSPWIALPYDNRTESDLRTP